MRIEATPKLREHTEQLIGPMVQESQAIVDDLTDAELVRFTESSTARSRSRRGTPSGSALPSRT